MLLQLSIFYVRKTWRVNYTNKKTKLKLALEESLNRVAVASDWPVCRQPLDCAITREAHRKRYPQHFAGASTDVGKSEAVLVTLKMKRENEK